MIVTGAVQVYAISTFYCSSGHRRSFQTIQQDRAEYVRGEEEGKGQHVARYDLAYVVCHYAEQQGVLIYYCGQWSIKS